MYRDSMSGPAYGPRPWLALENEPAEKLLESHLSAIRTDPRKMRARERWQVYTESYRELIKDRVALTHFDHEIIKRIFAHIDLANNIALDVVNSVCNVWKHSHFSNVSVEGASDRQTEALRELMEESGFHRHARAWNREGWLLGPITVVPVMRSGALSYDTLLPHFYDTIDNRADPWGAPLAASWDVSGNECAEIRPGHPVTSILLDGESWRYYHSKGGQHALVDTAEHGVGEFPGATLNFDIAHGGSRWECERHQRLIDATVKVGCLDASLDFVRKSQNKHLLTIIGNISQVADGQIQDPERPVVANVQSAGNMNIGTVPFDLDPDTAIRHQAWTMQNIARSYGGQVTGTSTSILEARISFSHEALTEQRNEQIPFAMEFMRDLLAKAVRTCKVQGHRLSAWLPTPDDIRKGLTVKWPPLARSFANVDEQIKWEADSLSRGKLDFADLLAPMLPGTSKAERTQHIVDNIAAQAPIIAMMTTRDQSLSPHSNGAKNETEAQRHGRTGPEVRDNKDEQEQ